MVEGVNRVGSILAERLAGLGLAVRRQAAAGFGDHLVATTGLPGRQIVLGGHMDTTYTDYASLPSFHVDGEFAVGPGVLDMKGGIVACLAALDSLKATGKLKTLPLTLLLNSDEERGSPTARELYREFIPGVKAALFAEPGAGDGVPVRARRGKISFRVDAQGETMHAGEGTGPKRSAILGLAHATIALEALNERFPGTAVNVGRLWGGVASNTVAASATALMDIRYPLADREPELRAAVAGICGAGPVHGVTCTASETSYRPVWNDPDSNRNLAALAGRLTGAAGAADEAPVLHGGTSDANWFGAAGVPTLDGLGPSGSGEHSDKERLFIPSLFRQAGFLARLICLIEREFTP
jgi:glutamate carboxypeptidase